MSRYTSDKSASNPKRSANVLLQTELGWYRQEAFHTLRGVNTDCIGWWLCTEAPTEAERAFWQEQQAELNKIVHKIGNHNERMKKKLKPEKLEA